LPVSALLILLTSLIDPCGSRNANCYDSLLQPLLLRLRPVVT
jgi:hypothetical protein